MSSSSDSSSTTLSISPRTQYGSAGATRPVQTRHGRQASLPAAAPRRKAPRSLIPRNQVSVNIPISSDNSEAPASSFRKTMAAKVRIYKYGALIFPNYREEATPDHFNPDNFVVPLLHMVYDDKECPDFLKGRSLLGFVACGTVHSRLWSSDYFFIHQNSSVFSETSVEGGDSSCFNVSNLSIPGWNNLPCSRFTQIRQAGGRRRGPLYEPKEVFVPEPEMIGTNEFPYGIRVAWSLEDGTTYWYPGRVDFKVKFPTRFVNESAGRTLPGGYPQLYLLEYEAQENYPTQQTFLVFIDKTLNIVIHPASNDESTLMVDSLFSDIVCEFRVISRDEKAVEKAKSNLDAVLGQSSSSSESIEVDYETPSD